MLQHKLLFHRMLVYMYIVLFIVLGGDAGEGGLGGGGQLRVSVLWSESSPVTADVSVGQAIAVWIAS